MAMGNGIGVYPPVGKAPVGKAPVGREPNPRPEVEFVVTTYTGDLVIKGDSFEIDDRIVIIRDRDGKNVAALNEWIGVRVKETV